MPLDKSCDKSAVSRNIRQLLKDNKPHKQAIAIALSVLKRSCGVKRDFQGSPKQILKKASNESMVPLSAVMQEGFGIDFAIRPTVRSLGLSPSASGDPHGRGRHQFHVWPGEAIVTKGDHLPRVGRKKKRKRRV